MYWVSQSSDSIIMLLLLWAAHTVMTPIGLLCHPQPLHWIISSHGKGAHLWKASFLSSSITPREREALSCRLRAPILMAFITFAVAWINDWLRGWLWQKPRRYFRAPWLRVLVKLRGWKVLTWKGFLPCFPKPVTEAKSTVCRLCPQLFPAHSLPSTLGRRAAAIRARSTGCSHTNQVAPAVTRYNMLYVFFNMLCIPLKVTTATCRNFEFSHVMQCVNFRLFQVPLASYYWYCISWLHSIAHWAVQQLSSVQWDPPKQRLWMITYTVDGSSPPYY